MNRPYSHPYKFLPVTTSFDQQNFSLMSETCSTTMWRAPYNSDAEVYVDVQRHQVVTATYGGFYGDDPFISITSLDQQLRTKEDRYFLNGNYQLVVELSPLRRNDQKNQEWLPKSWPPQNNRYWNVKTLISNKTIQFLTSFTFILLSVSSFFSLLYLLFISSFIHFWNIFSTLSFLTFQLSFNS